MNKAYCLLFAFVVVLLLHGDAAQAQDPPEQAGIKAARSAFARPFINLTGQPVRNLPFKTLDGKTYDLAKFKGKPLLISFFRLKECPPCVEQLETMATMSLKYKAAGLAIVAMIQERAGLESTPDEIGRALKPHAQSWLAAYVTEEIAEAMGNSKIVPYNVYITPSGKIFRQTAGQTASAMDQTIQQLLAVK